MILSTSAKLIRNRLKHTISIGPCLLDNKSETQKVRMKIIVPLKSNRWWKIERKMIKIFILAIGHGKILHFVCFVDCEFRGEILDEKQDEESNRKNNLKLMKNILPTTRRAKNFPREFCEKMRRLWNLNTVFCIHPCIPIST